jgi:hypothetical protein
MVVAIVSSALPAFLIPRMESFPMMLALFAVFALSTGSMVGSTSPLLLRLLGLAALSQTFGLVTAMRGVAALMGPPLAGLVVDQLGETGLALDMSGVLFLVSTMVCLAAIFRYQVTSRRAQYLQLV